MDFRILGPLDVLDEGRAIKLRGSKQRALLALLLLHANETLSTDRLIDELWGEQPPANAAKTVQMQISRLRKALTAEADNGSASVVVTRERGYELRLDPDRLDAHRFERLVAEGRSELAGGHPQRAAAALEDALSLWRGSPLADLAYEPFAQQEIARLDDLRVVAREVLIEAKLTMGLHTDVVRELERQVNEHPYRERLHAQLMLALYRCDRQADALQAYQDARKKLVEELGIEPGVRLRELERAVLAQDPRLHLPAEQPTAAEPAVETSRSGFVSRDPLDALPNNLPQPWTSFVGRQRELDETRTELEATRLLTLTGVGGCGKTRLAVRAAAVALERFPDGGWWVELAPLSDPDLIGSALAQALGIRPLSGQSDLDAAVSHLHHRRALVVLDNCEHLLEHAAGAARALLEGCPDVTVLATSRAPLGLPGETDWRVPSLSLPTDDARGQADVASNSDAVRLFVERARKVRPSFRVTDDNAAEIAAICRELDGIPLAIELAAARVRLLSATQIADGLSDRFRLLTRGNRAALPRQQTLRASVDWSHALLSEHEQALFRRLGAFAGGFTLGAAERVCAGDELPREAILDLLASLVEKSLVQAEHGERAVRFGLLETVRQYALERLRHAGEVERLRDSHRDAYLAFAERVEPRVMTSDQAASLELLDAEAANLMTALEWAAESEPVKALELCVALMHWWRLRGLFSPGEAAYSRALQRAHPAADPALYARVLSGRAYLLAYAGDEEGAVKAAESALTEAEKLGDRSTMARALNAVGIARILPDPLGSRPGLESACRLAEASGDDWCLINASQVLAYTYMFQEDYDSLRRVLNRVLPIVERVGAAERWAWHWFGIGYALYASGNHAACREMLEQALTAAREVGEPTSEGAAIAFLELAEVHAGRAEGALERLTVVRERAAAMGAGLTLPWIEIAVAQAEAALGRLEQARSRLQRFEDAGGRRALHALLMCEVLLAEILRLLGEGHGATERGRRALEIADELGNEWYAAKAKLVLGRLDAASGERAKAERLHHEALATVVERGFTLDLPVCLEALAEVVAGLEDHDAAARMLGAAGSVRRALAVKAWKPQRAEVAELTERIREELGDDRFEETLAAGGALSEDEAVAWVLRSRSRLRDTSAVQEGATKPKTRQ